MVKNSRETWGPRVVRSLNLPQLIEVEEDDGHRPLAIVSRPHRNQRMIVIEIKEIWDIRDEWWKETSIARRYFTVITENGNKSTIFRDLYSGIWFQQRE